MNSPYIVFALIVWAVIVSVLLFQQLSFWAKNTSDRLMRVEEKLDRLMAALNVPLTTNPLRLPTIGDRTLTDMDGMANSKVGEWLRRGQRINAVKFYREQMGVDLRTAKEAVEALEAEMRAKGLI